MYSHPTFRLARRALLSAVLSLLACSAAADLEDEPLPITEIAPRVFMGDLGGSYGANQTFIIFDDFVVVFDPGRVLHARRLLKRIRRRTDKPIRYVIDSHFHPDHSAGAAVFARLGAEVVAAAQSRHHFENWAKNDFARRLREDPQTYHDLEYSPPTRYLEEPWVIDDGTQRLEVHYFGPGHTDSDLVGWLPEYRVMLAGDLSTNGQHNLANANVASWISVLGKMRELHPLVVIPGHLQPGGPELLEKSQRYLVELRAQVKGMMDRGMDFEDILQSVKIPFYEEWSGVRVRDERTNVERVYRELGGKIEPPPRFGLKEVVAGLLVFAVVLAGALTVRRRFA